MDRYYNNKLEHIKTEGNPLETRVNKLEKLTSLALTGTIIVLFNYSMLNEMLHRYWT